MTERLTTLRLASLNAALALAAAIVAAGAGLLVATNPTWALAVVAAIALAHVVFVDLALALGVWLALHFVIHTPELRYAHLLMSGVIVVAWLRELTSPGTPVHDAWRRHPAVVLAPVPLALWFGLSLAWADRADRAQEDLWSLYAVSWWAFPIIATAVTAPRDLRVLLWGFVFGAALAVVIGLASAGVTPEATTAVQLADQAENVNRLASGEDDPNTLAASLVPAVAFAAGLMAVARAKLSRLLLIGGIATLSVGLALTASRGGLVSGAVALIGALMLVQRRRAWVFALSSLALGSIAIALAVNSGTWTRITDEKYAEGSGRSELWAAAWQMTADHPLNGVGVGNFTSTVPAYADKLGQLEYAEVLTESPHWAHSIFLQTLAETGVVGFGLLLLLLGACLGSMWVAGRRLERLAEPGLATLARAVLVAALGMLVAASFLSMLNDRRLVVVLALGPALLALSSNVAARRPIRA